MKTLELVERVERAILEAAKGGYSDHVSVPLALALTDLAEIKARVRRLSNLLDDPSVSM